RFIYKMRKLFLFVIFATYNLFSDTIFLKNGRVIDDVRVSIDDRHLITTDKNGRNAKYKKFTIKSLKPQQFSVMLPRHHFKLFRVEHKEQKIFP
ncbi:MAG: hypothetical protein KDK45_22910, partial [Leptospiraceae bacterium]|nr:hypothetical protein [Leptospiraceae bacterium]